MKKIWLNRSDNYQTTSRLLIATSMIFGIGSTLNAATTIDLTTSGPTGSALDISTTLASLPLTVSVGEISGLSLSILSGTTNADANDTTVNGAGSSFGVNSPGGNTVGENATRFEADFDESLTIAFNEPLIILAVDFGNFGTGEGFSFGGITVTETDIDSNDNFTFPDGGLVVPAGSGVLLEAINVDPDVSSSIGLQSISVQVIPEPSIALLGFLASALCLKRRRS